MDFDEIFLQGASSAILEEKNLHLSCGWAEMCVQVERLWTLHSKSAQTVHTGC